MPHFIIDCSANVLVQRPETEILKAVGRAARASWLFNKSDIKVRVNPYAIFEVGGTTKDFIHVFGYILEGRTADQKATLSRKLVKALSALFPDVENIAVSIEEFSLSGYYNKQMHISN